MFLRVTGLRLMNDEIGQSITFKTFGYITLNLYVA